MNEIKYICFIFLFATLGTLTLSCSNTPRTTTFPPQSTSLPSTSSPVTLPPVSTTPAAVTIYGYRVVNTYPHDPTAFTQGLTFDNGFLYEGTGLKGKSTLRKVELATGRVLQIRELPAELFGEGVTIYQKQIIQLTWRSQLGFVYDKSSLDVLREFSYSTEGWGITQDGKCLIMSDGTPTLHFLDPNTFAETGSIEVYDENGAVSRLNELEYIRGRVYANVWQEDYILIISPDTGMVTGRIDLKGILPEEDRKGTDVLNGIAYDAKGDRLFVTGKFWPRLFEITLVAP